MNRITAVLLAMIALLVHALVVHRDASGAFAPPYDGAHAAYVLGRHLAESGETFWRQAADGTHFGSLASYPSPLLVWIAAGLDLLTFNVDRAAQVIGMLCALATVFLSTRFDTDRIAGVIPALLLVTSGAVAAAGASGTEWPVAMFALTTAFVALEHGRGRVAAVALVALVLVRPEGIFAAAALAAMTAVRRRHKDGPAFMGRRAPRLTVFLPAACALAVAHAAGASLVDDAARVFAPETRAALHGTRQLLDFVVATATPALLAFPIIAIFRGGLSNVGLRALVVTAVWMVPAVLMGGGTSPFGLAFAPVLPVMFIAIQQGMARALDTYRRSMEQLVWVCLGVGMVGALLASRFPGNLGPLRLLELQTELHTARAEPPLGQSPLTGRSAVFAELRLVGRLRRMGSFLGKRTPAGTSVLSPWPGVLAWRGEGLQVVDVFGRTEALGGAPRAPWSPEPGAPDLVAALETEPDYILPAIGGLDDYVDGVLPDLLPERLFRFADEPRGDVLAAARPLLARYEPFVTTGRSLPSRFPSAPLLLLRRRSGSNAPVLEGRVRGDRVEVTARFGEGAQGGLPQVCDVQVRGRFADGSVRLLDPLGQDLGDDPEGGGTSCTGIVLDPAWAAAVTVAEVGLAAGSGARAGLTGVEVRLIHHRFPPADPRADAAAPLELRELR